MQLLVKIHTNILVYSRAPAPWSRDLWRSALIYFSGVIVTQTYYPHFHILELNLFSEYGVVLL